MRRVNSHPKRPNARGIRVIRVIRLIRVPDGSAPFAPSATEVYSLSEVPEVLATDPRYWPTANVSLALDDIVVTRTGLGNAAMLDVSVTIRNHGRVDARDLIMTTAIESGAKPDLPRRSARGCGRAVRVARV